MNALMIGDIVGPDAAPAGTRPGRLLRRAHGVYLVIANAENWAVTAPVPWTGFGIAVGLVGRLLESGDVVALGNHGCDGPEAEAVHRHLRVRRPHNYFPEEVMGKGVATPEIGGESVSGINLGSPPAAMPGALPPYGS